MTTIALHISEDSAKLLTDAFGPDVSRAALEALAIEGYRAGKFGTATVGRLVAIEHRFEVEKWLGSRDVYMNYTAQDLADDVATLDRLLGKVA